MAEGRVVENLDMQESAVWHAEEGRRVFRLRSRGKKPLKPGWQERATSDPDRVRGLWKARPTANVGMRTGRESGVVVVDVDIDLPEEESKAEFWGRVEEKDPDALERLEEVRRRMEAIREQYPTDRIYRSGSGGYLMVYQYPPGLGDEDEVKNRAKVGGEAVDVRGDGGYIVLPPSIHPDTGAPYEVLEDGEPGPTAPEFVLQRSGPGNSVEARRKATSGRGVASLWTGVSHGGRNDACASLAGSLARRGVPEEEAAQILLAWNLRNAPPIGDHPDDGEPAEVEIPRTVASIYRKEQQRREREGESEEATPFRVIGSREFHAKYGNEKEDPFLVEEWVPSQAFGILGGPPESFKSWTLYDLAISVASGAPFLGEFEVNDPGPVIVLQLEDAMRKMRARMDLLEHFKLGATWPPSDVLQEDRAEAVLVGNLPIHVHDEYSFDLDPGTLNQLAEHIRRLAVKLVVVDPLFTVGNTDDYLASTAKQMQPLKQIREDTGCGFFFGHHTTLAGSDSTEREGLWGSQFLNASQNVSWRVRTTGVHGRVVVQRYLKDGGRPPEVAVTFKIERPLKGDKGWAYEVAVEETKDAPFGSPSEGEDNWISDEEIRRRVYHYVADHPGCGANDIYAAIDTRDKRIKDMRDELASEKGRGPYIENRSSGKGGHSWHPTDEPLLDESF